LAWGRRGECACGGGRQYRLDKFPFFSPSQRGSVSWGQM
jgi:hypothetical protein